MGIFIYFQNITKSQKVNLKIQQVHEVVERTCTSLLFHFKPQRREESLKASMNSLPQDLLSVYYK